MGARPPPRGGRPQALARAGEHVDVCAPVAGAFRGCLLRVGAWQRERTTASRQRDVLSEPCSACYGMHFGAGGSEESRSYAKGVPSAARRVRHRPTRSAKSLSRPPPLPRPVGPAHALVVTALPSSYFPLFFVCYGGRSDDEGVSMAARQELDDGRRPHAELTRNENSLRVCENSPSLWPIISSVICSCLYCRWVGSGERREGREGRQGAASRGRRSGLPLARRARTTHLLAVVDRKDQSGEGARGRPASVWRALRATGLRVPRPAVGKGKADDAPLPGGDDVCAPGHRLDRLLGLCVLAQVGDRRRVGQLPDGPAQGYAGRDHGGRGRGRGRRREGSRPADGTTS